MRQLLNPTLFSSVKHTQVAPSLEGKGTFTESNPTPQRSGLGRCSNCKTPAILYQYKTCKICLVADFKRLRPMIDMTRQITITRYDYQDNLCQEGILRTIPPLVKGGLGGIQ